MTRQAPKMCFDNMPFSLSMMYPAPWPPSPNFPPPWPLVQAYTTSCVQAEAKQAWNAERESRRKLGAAQQRLELSVARSSSRPPPLLLPSSPLQNPRQLQGTYLCCFTSLA